MREQSKSKSNVGRERLLKVDQLALTRNRLAANVTAAQPVSALAMRRLT